jgi:alkylhydroperoxidase/carboxymuconolactone decarboxylase family protein YurZ
MLPTAHLSLVERPDEFATLVLRFLQEERSGNLDDETRRARGRAVRAAVLGEAHVQRVESAADPLTATFHDLLTRYAWGEIWTRPELDHRTRRVLVIGTLIALGRWEEFRLHARAALTEGGFTAAQLEEIVLQQAIYCGVPAANTAFDHLRQVLAD